MNQANCSLFMRHEKVDEVILAVIQSINYGAKFVSLKVFLIVD